VVHGHFYQPPRENPWTGEVDEQPSAAPFHDWNERVHDECYRPNTRVQIDGREVNNFERISFNIGPTLLGWMEAAGPDEYARILEADAASIARVGRGNALAQAYHHSILPLARRRDVRTEIRWGVADFRHRFGREPEGMWLAETAANEDVLAELIDEGITFTVLAPYQAALWRLDGGPWNDVRDEPLDTRVAYRFAHPDGSGRSLAIFFYDAEISRAIAFERAPSSASRFVDLFADRSRGYGIVNAATDGETYGHHQKFSDLGLAYALFTEAPARGIEVTNYAAELAANPPAGEVRLVEGEGSSWSCFHGVGRWKRDCGCSTGGEPGWNQSWRLPLRTALEIAKAGADDAYARLGHMIFRDPWGARDRYIQVVLSRIEDEEFVRREAGRSLDPDEVARGKILLDMQRNALAMFTSCAWFFNDLSGIETVQILRYTARALELIDELGAPVPIDEFVGTLATARSNVPEQGTGADIFLRVLENDARAAISRS
jgi:alpha-amylase/alpha-mannosidase (GH57 family)